MTLEEAIQHAEEVMVENLEKTKGRNASDPIAINCFECADEHRQLAEWLRKLKRLREQTRWIPVSEKLPEESITVIGITRFDDIYKTELYDDCGEKKWCADGDFDVPIVAWMPLPPPYKAESKEGGTLLPEGHGRLIDADKLRAEYTKPHLVGYDEIIADIDRQPTVVESEGIWSDK